MQQHISRAVCLILLAWLGLLVQQSKAKQSQTKQRNAKQDIKAQDKDPSL